MVSPPSPSYYDAMQVRPDASADEIRQAWRQLARRHHPDKGAGDSELMARINEAYEVLSDFERRARYDDERRVRTGRKTRPLRPLTRTIATPMTWTLLSAAALATGIVAWTWLRSSTTVVAATRATSRDTTVAPAPPGLAAAPTAFVDEPLVLLPSRQLDPSRATPPPRQAQAEPMVQMAGQGAQQQVPAPR